MRYGMLWAVGFAAVATLSIASRSTGAVIFDDAFQGGWSNDWGQAQTENVHSGTAALKTGQSWGDNGQVVLTNAGVTMGAATSLDFYVNTITNDSVSSITLKINDLEFDKNGGGVYMVDGVEQTGSFATDADSSTWQHVTFDMTQPYYTWDSGWQSSNLGPATSIIKLQWGQNTNLLMDDISTTGVPEPTVLSLIGFAGLALKSRRRA